MTTDTLIKARRPNTSCASAGYVGWKYSSITANSAQADGLYHCC